MNKIDFEYQCKEHSQKIKYSRYCLSCGKSICILCIKSKKHEGHLIENLDDLIIDDDKYNEIKNNQSRLKLFKEELSNKHDEIKMINNKIMQLSNIITKLIKEIKERYKLINSDFEFNEKIINSYEREETNYYILNKIQSLKFAMNNDNLKLDILYEKLDELKLIGGKNMWISENYCKDWGLKEGIREFLQNQYDEVITLTKSKNNINIKKYGEIYTIKGKKSQLNFEFSKIDVNKICGKIEYDKINKILSISNEGEICLADFLLGGTKEEQANLNCIGHFGEGMKLAILALCRENKNVIILSSNQKYTFSLKEDPNFKKESKIIKCLHCNIESINKNDKDYMENENQVKVIINNISEEEWSNQINNFLWLIENDIEIYTSIEKECELGQMIFEDYLKGKLFIKGIYVQEISNYDFKKNLPGFNLYTLKTNRDRNIIQNDFELKENLSRIVSGIFNKNIKYLTNVQKKEGKSFEQNNYGFKEKNYFSIGKPINPNFKYLTQNLLYCLQNKSKKIFDPYTLSSKLSQECKNLIWDEMNLEKDNNGKQPICYENDIKNFIKNRKLSKNFYPYYIVSWDLYYILKYCSKYESIEDKYSRYKKDIIIVSPDKEHQNALNNINSILKRNLSNCENKNIHIITFEESDINFCFFENNDYIFNCEKLKEKPDINWKFWIICKILKMEEINFEDNYEIFYELFDN